MQMWLLSMWICGPLSKAPPLSSPLHPSSWQRLQTAFSHAFPKSRYVDSIRLTSHNGEFVQQEELHYLNPSVALPLFEICGLDWHGLPSVSFMDRQKVNSSAPFEVHKTWLSSIDAKFTLSLQNISIPPQLLSFFWPTLLTFWLCLLHDSSKTLINIDKTTQIHVVECVLTFPTIVCFHHCSLGHNQL